VFTCHYDIVVVVRTASRGPRGAYLAIDRNLLNIRRCLHRSSFIVAAFEQLDHLEVRHAAARTHQCASRESEKRGKQAK
jgi:hypothetical protein